MDKIVKINKELERKKEYIKPDIQTDTIYETRALGCGQCLEAGNTYKGEGCDITNTTY